MKLLDYRVAVATFTLLFGLLSSSSFVSASSSSLHDGDKDSDKAIVVSQHTPEEVSPARPDIKPPKMRMGMCTQCCGCMCSGGMCKPGKMMKPMLSSGPRMMKHKMMKGMKHMQMQKDCCGGNHLLGLAGELKLTEEQKAKIESIHLKTKLALVDLKATITKERIKLKKLIRDEEKITKIKLQMEAVLKAEMDLKLKKITTGRKIQGILTDEQREKIKCLKPMHGMMGLDIEEPDDMEEIEIIFYDEDSHMEHGLE